MEILVMERLVNANKLKLHKKELAPGVGKTNLTLVYHQSWREGDVITAFKLIDAENGVVYTSCTDENMTMYQFNDKRLKWYQSPWGAENFTTKELLRKKWAVVKANGSISEIHDYDAEMPKMPKRKIIYDPIDLFFDGRSSTPAEEALQDVCDEENALEISENLLKYWKNLHAKGQVPAWYWAETQQLQTTIDARRKQLEIAQKNYNAVRMDNEFDENEDYDMEL